MHKTAACLPTHLTLFLWSKKDNHIGKKTNMDRIATIKSLIKITNALEKGGFYKEAQTLDYVIRRIASIENEGGLNGEYDISRAILNDIENPKLSDDLPNFDTAENMIEELPDRFLQDNIFDEEDEEIDPEEKELRLLASRWSTGKESALHGFAVSGMIVDLDDHARALEEIDRALDLNTDPEEYIRLRDLEAHLIMSIPLIIPFIGYDSIKDIKIQPRSTEKGLDVMFFFRTDRGFRGVLNCSVDHQENIIPRFTGIEDNGEYKSMHYSNDQIKQLAEAFFRRLHIETGGDI
jgi:hypothetical protein